MQKVQSKRKKLTLPKNFSYKDYEELSKFLTERARIIPAKRSGLSAKKQRILSREIKRARFLGLLPYKPEV